MNPENDMYRHFILNQRKTILPQRKIYTPQYFCLMLTMIVIGGTQYKQNMFFRIYPFLYEYILAILVIFIAFIITSFSQFIGHRILYIISFTSYSILQIVIHYYGGFQLTWILITTLRFMLFSQIIIQIYGVWPQKFGRIFVELWLFYFTMRFILLIIDTYINVRHLSDYILIAIILVNFIWLVCGFFIPIFISIKDFKSPETDNVLKDFGRLLCNIKIGVFTILFASAQLSLQILSFYQNFIQYNITQEYSTTIIKIIDGVVSFLAIILLLYLVNLNYKPSFMILISFIPLVLCLLIIILFLEAYYLNDQILFLLAFIFNYFFYIVISYAQVTFITSQYYQILLNIGIRNLDFVSSCQLLVFGQTYIFYLYSANNQQNFILENLRIIIILLIASIIILSVVFYQLLGFKQYMRNQNLSQIQIDSFQIEIA